MGLTKQQRRVLIWLRDTPHHRARWMVGDQEAFGDRSTWTHIEIAGRARKIRVSAAVMVSLSKLIRTANKREPDRMWVPNKKGLAAINATVED